MIEYVFTKADGSIRHMLTATFEWAKRNHSEAWEKVKPKGIRSNDNPNIIKVWDVENKSFRSIRKDRVIGKRYVAEKKRAVSISVRDDDIYHKTYRKPYTEIRPGKTPYYIMILLNGGKATREKLTEQIEGIFDILGKQVNVKRNVRRVLNSYVKSGMLVLSADGTYNMAKKGKLYLSSNVEGK